jgi:hypothetical protein
MLNFQVVHIFLDSIISYTVKKRKTTAFAGILRFLELAFTVLISRRPELKPPEIKLAAWQEQEGYCPAATYRLEDKFPFCVAV